MKTILRSAVMAGALIMAAIFARAQTQQPYLGTPISLPGTIEAENFDTGGQGVSFYDITVANSGGKYRNESVDIESCSEGGFNVYKIETYEWLEYTVNVTENGSYNFEFRTASTNSDGKITMSLDGNSVGFVHVLSTGNMQKWTSAQQYAVYLSQGVHVLRLSFSNSSVHYDMFSLDKVIVSKEAQRKPFLGTPIALPGTIEAEDFDIGGQGVSFYDVTVANTGGKYRNEFVDIETCSEGGFNIYRIDTYEWLEYTVNVTESANYSFDFRVASTNSAGKIDMSVNGSSIGSVNITSTGGMQTWNTLKKSGVALNAGVHVLRLSFSNSLVHYDMFNLNNIVVSKEAPVQLPYLGTPVALPGTIEAENFDKGGQAISFYDVTVANSGGKYRNESVDIETCSDGGFNIYKIETYEWLEYTVNITERDGYKFEFKVASSNSAGKIDVTIDGKSIGSVNVPNTGGMQTWRTVKFSYGGFGVTLDPGVHVMRLSFSNTQTHYDMFNLDKIVVSKATQYSFTHLSIPGIIEAENYDVSGGTKAYHDLTAGNSGGVNRSVGRIPLSEDVDIEACSEGGRNIGWIQAGEWLEYTVNVMNEDVYSLSARVASSTSNGSFQLLLDGNILTDVIPVPNTGGWQNWRSVSKSNIPLSAGTHALRIKMTGGDFNLNNLEFTKATSKAGCTGKYSQDYSYVVSPDAINPTITFNPILNGVGSTTLILYYGTGSGVLSGHIVKPGVPFQINASHGQTIKFYYTYSHPAGGERNSSATPHTVVIGSCGSVGRLSDMEAGSAEIKHSVYPNPMGKDDLLYFSEKGKNVSVKIVSVSGKVVMEKKNWNTESALDLSSLDKGIFNVIIQKGSKIKTSKIVR